MATVNISWTIIPFSANDSGSSIVSQWERETRGNPQDLDRSVYVIRLAEKFSILYHEGSSPVVYIGQGGFQNRIWNHLRDWIQNLSDELGDPEFEVAIALPRVRNNVDAYSDFEAYLIDHFTDKYGIAPLINKRQQSLRYQHSYDGTPDPVDILHERNSHRWAVKPLRTNGKFYENYFKGL